MAALNEMGGGCLHDRLFWAKHEGDGKRLTPVQSMVSGFCAAVLGPVATCPFDVVKVCITRHHLVPVTSMTFLFPPPQTSNPRNRM